MSKLLDKTRELLIASDKPLRQIAKESGLNFHTVQKLRCIEYSVPSVEFCEALYEYLSGKELEL